MVVWFLFVVVVVSVSLLVHTSAYTLNSYTVNWIYSVVLHFLVLRLYMLLVYFYRLYHSAGHCSPTIIRKWIHVCFWLWTKLNYKSLWFHLLNIFSAVIFHLKRNNCKNHVAQGFCTNTHKNIYTYKQLKLSHIQTCISFICTTYFVQSICINALLLLLLHLLLLLLTILPLSI